ncbi:DNA polymerase III subunit psi [Pseudolysobacter antarcticus]|nr:DNA polymerase III subunit psi [Pseudolysobacter antarcticus]
MLVETQRQQFLEAMGVDVYVLRSRIESPITSIDAIIDAEKTPASVAMQQPRLAIVCERADGNSHEVFERQAALILRALGVDATQIEWLFADAKQLEQTPPALNIWLVLGEHLARVLGQQLSTQQQNASVIAVALSLPNALRGAANKSAFWQALKPIARALRKLAASAPASPAQH